MAVRLLIGVVLVSLLLVSQDAVAARDRFINANENEKKNMKNESGAGFMDEKLGYGGGGYGGGYGGRFGGGYGGYIPGRGWYGGEYGGYPDFGDGYEDDRGAGYTGRYGADAGYSGGEGGGVSGWH